MKKVMVTGAAGQLGYMTYDALRSLEDTYEVYALDRLPDASDRVPGDWSLNLPPDRFFACDLNDAQGLRTAFQDMDIVVHLAADPEGDVWTSLLNSNITGVYQVFEACRATGVSRIVAASSIMVSEGHRQEEPYRAMMDRRFDDIPGPHDPITPEIPAEPRDLYACSKVWLESLARTYSHVHDMSCICVRVGQIERDRPRPPQGADIYVSQRDIVQMMLRCVAAPEDVRFDIFYGLSNNDLLWVDIEHARRRIGYVPQDRAEASHDYDRGR